MDYRTAKYETCNSSMAEREIKLPGGRIMMESDVNIVQSSSVDPTNTEDRAKKVLSLRLVLERDPKAADLKWSLFVAACNTYRYNSCLKPFPPMYIKNECKDIEALREAVELIPPLTVMLKELKEPNVYERYATVIELLHWVLVRMGDPSFKTINKDAFNSVLSKVPSTMPAAPPNLIFQLASAKQSMAEERWKRLAQDHSKFFAYHGSRLENFHSIIHYGLQQSLCKRSVFGQGIYLSSELGVSLPYSPVGYGWGGCVLGSKMSCIALCEVIEHADVTTGDSNLGESSQSTLTDASQEKVPNKYYLVTNSELVRVRYLLVYSQESPVLRSTDSRGMFAWFKQHKLLTFVLGYVVLLASVGLTHNKQMEKYYKLFVQRMGLE